MEQFDSSEEANIVEEASSRVLEQQQRNDEQQCPSCAAELTEATMLPLPAFHHYEGFDNILVIV